MVLGCGVNIVNEALLEKEACALSRGYVYVNVLARVDLLPDVVGLGALSGRPAFLRGSGVACWPLPSRWWFL